MTAANREMRSNHETHVGATTFLVAIPAQTFALQMRPDLMSDTIHFNYHGCVTSGIDALCHFEYKGRLYNSTPTTTNTEEGNPPISVTGGTGGAVNVLATF